MMCNIAVVEARESAIRWLKGCQNHPTVERVVESASRTGQPTANEIGEVGPSLLLYGFSELAERTRPNDKGRFQRRVFFRVMSKAGASLPTDRMMRPGAGMTTQDQSEASEAESRAELKQLELQESEPVAARRLVPAEYIPDQAFGASGGIAHSAGQNRTTIRKPSELPDEVYS